MRVPVTMIGVLVFMFGCTPSFDVGTQLTFPTQKDVTIVEASAVSEAGMTNRQGVLIPGLVLEDVSLIRTPAELAGSAHSNYVVFHDFFLGNAVASRFFQQQADKRKGVGLPLMDTRTTQVSIIAVDSNHTILDFKSRKAAHVQISVNTNDFQRTFEP